MVPPKCGKRNQTVQIERVHQDFPSDLGQRTEGQARTIGRNPRRQRNRAQMGHGVLVGAVVVHRPDFFVAAAAADKIDLALGDSGNAAAQAEDNFVGKLVRDRAGRVAGRRILILLAQHLRRGHVLHVVEPALHGHAVAGHAQVAERQHGGIRRRRAPAFKLHIGRRAHLTERIKALRNHVEDAGIVQIVPQRVVEGLEQVGVLGVLGGSLEIGNRQADFFDTQSGAGANPVLGKTGAQQKTAVTAVGTNRFD